MQKNVESIIRKMMERRRLKVLLTVENLCLTYDKKIIFNHVRDDKTAILLKCRDKIKFDYHIANDGDIIEI